MERNLISILMERSTKTPNKIAYTFLDHKRNDETNITYGELCRRVQDVAVYLCGEGVSGERVLILYPSGIEYVICFLACLASASIAVPVYPPKNNNHFERLKLIANNAEAKFAFVSRELSEKLDAERMSNVQHLEGIRFFCVEDIIGAKIKQKKILLQGDQVAFLQYTSGSTGKPKGVMVTNNNIINNANSIRKRCELSDKDVFVSWLPMYHDMGLMNGVMLPLVTGSRCVLMSPVSFLQKPILWLNAIDQYNASYSGGPNFSYDFCCQKIDIAEVPDLHLGHWRVAYNGAEPIRMETLLRFAEKFSYAGFSLKKLYPCYGLAECTVAVSGGDVEEMPVSLVVKASALKENIVKEIFEGEDGKILVGSGYALEHCEICIKDPVTFEDKKDGEIGEIVVSGRSVAKGYWNDKGLSDEVFVKDQKSGLLFLRTGDLGFLKNGELFVTGRIKDLLIIHGKNYYPQDVEKIIEDFDPALRLTGCAVFSVERDREEKVVVVQEIEREFLKKIDIEKMGRGIRGVIWEEWGVPVAEVVFVKPASIPKTSSGKVQRSLCKKFYLENKLSVVGKHGLKFCVSI